MAANTMKIGPIAAPPQQGGFGLIEVLVTVIIIAVAVLSLAGLQTKSLKNNNDAFSQTKATLAASAILDSIRANRGQANEYKIDFSSVSAGSGLAKKDLRHWQTMLEELPQGKGKIEPKNCKSLSDKLCKVAVTIVWHAQDDEQVNTIGAGEQKLVVKTVI